MVFHGLVRILIHAVEQFVFFASSRPMSEVSFPLARARLTA